MATGNAGVFGDFARYRPAGASRFLNGRRTSGVATRTPPRSLNHGAPVLHRGIRGRGNRRNGGRVRAGLSFAAIIAGYEVPAASPRSDPPRAKHYDRGFHPPNCGASARGWRPGLARVFWPGTPNGGSGDMGTVLSAIAGMLQFLRKRRLRPQTRLQVVGRHQTGLMAATLSARRLQGCLRRVGGKPTVHARL